MENSARKSAIKLTVKKQKILSTLIRRTKRKVQKIVPVSRTICKFLSLLQNEEQSITSCDTRICNQATQCEYENFADELMRDQFIAVLISESLCIETQDSSQKSGQSKVTLREVVDLKSQDNQKSLNEKSLKYPKAGKFDKEDNPRKLELRHVNSGSFLVLRSASQSSSTTLSSVRKTVQ